MSDFVKLMAIALPLQFAFFVLLHRYGRLKAKQVMLLVMAVSLGLFVPFGILTWNGLDQFAYRVAFLVTFPYVYGIITSHWEERAERGDVGSGRFFHWAPMTMFFFFVGIAIVDSIIISLADKGMSSSFAERFLPRPRSSSNVVSYFPGNVSHDFQQKEALYNEYLEQQKKQAALGWTVHKGWVSNPLAGKSSRFKVSIEGPDKQLIADATVKGIFLRPGNSRLDTSFEMSPDGSGAYIADLSLPVPGRWSVVIHILRGDDQYELRASTSVNEAAAATR